MKTVVITGGVRGIGRAAALMFAERGYAVAACYEKNGAAADALSAALRETGVPFLVSRADVSDASAVGAFVAAASRLTGKVDVLVNNAGISSFGLFQELKEDAFDRLFAVNCKGAYLAAREVLPGMISRREGSIVNVSSVWGITGASCEAAYSASKAWLIGLTRALAKEAGPSGVRVNCACPGVIDTDMNAHLGAADRAALAEETPLGRIGTPEDAARTIVYLAEEPFVTGQVVAADGGFSL